MITMYAIEDERWDSLCLRAYGMSNSSLVKGLRESNRALASEHSFTLPGGARLNIPKLPANATEPKSIGLAPWQR
ncbi:tail protein X [Vibrio sp. OPT18]|uniref:tail protein X n=1 Tax=Vibrio sp. OPT18 TaxID=2778641 RepID=UPI00187E2E0A|nr:tail protein X [Vibrio sp. OPT18]